VIEAGLDADNLENVIIGAGELRNLPAGIQAPPGVTYSCIRVVTSVTKEIENVVFENVTVNFKVPKTWIRQNDVDLATIRLFKYGDVWVPLKTELVGENAEYVYFRAWTTGLSIFAIAGEKAPWQWHSIVIPATIAIVFTAAIFYKLKSRQAVKRRRKKR
jgi:PGF-pre-PGF domain-containing protein